MVKVLGVAMLAASSIFSAVEASALPPPKQLSLAKPFALDNKWKISGDAVIGNDVIMFAQKPGDAGAVWSSNAVPFEEWTIETQIKVFVESPNDKEPDRSGFAIWFTDAPLPGGPVHGAADLWDGLAVMMDYLGTDGRGEVRGHLNDGSYRFEASTNLQQDALSLCMLPYRNTDGFVKVTVGYGQGMFIVQVNGQICFWSGDISLGPGYLGLSANSGASHDKLVTAALSITEGVSADLLAQIPADQRKGDSKHAAAPKTPVAAAGAAGMAKSEQITLDTQEINAPVLRAIETLSSRIDTLSSNAGAGTGKEVSGPDMGALRKEFIGRLDTIESSIKQLVDISSKLALTHNSGDVSKELQNLRTQIDEHQKSLPTAPVEDAKSSASDGPGVYTILVLVFVMQSVVVFGGIKYWEKQQARHQKLM